MYPIFSLPSRFGIGCFSKEAYEFVDFLASAGQGYWQILPVGPTGFGNSPYQPFSTFAGNPYFISPESLVQEGLLNWDECNGCYFGSDQQSVDYGALYENRFKLLKIAFDRFMERGMNEGNEYKKFLEKEAFWLSDYALFMAIKEDQGGASWLEWDEKYKKRDSDAIKAAEDELKESVEFFRFQQYEFDHQWRKLHAYANSRKVKIIGDLPFYVALDSADAWSHPEVFKMDENLSPKEVSGCPPDAFSPTGQLWGNPVYDWEALKSDGYGWWIRRIERNYEFYDVIRIDHFHGFAEYYAIPFGDPTAEHGSLLKSPGMDFFNALKDSLGDIHLIAEDLGNNTPENEKLLEDSGFPGMKVLQYAFTSWDSYYLNHRHIRNCVVYTGTHDNTPTRAWIEEISDGERDFARRYINSMNTDYGRFVWDFIREAYRSVADLCIIPIQDYLCRGREARINCPGWQGGNWQWRLAPNSLSNELCRSIRELSELYGRIPQDKPKASEDGDDKKVE